ncbi:MAG: hypothetical protein GY795_28145 [Desulfobacterales bacterium]|nr:hypothetical protein [Desulfobacterales bacterium]
MTANNNEVNQPKIENKNEVFYIFILVAFFIVSLLIAGRLFFGSPEKPPSHTPILVPNELPSSTSTKVPKLPPKKTRKTIPTLQPSPTPIPTSKIELGPDETRTINPEDLKKLKEGHDEKNYESNEVTSIPLYIKKKLREGHSGKATKSGRASINPNDLEKLREGHDEKPQP